MKNDMKYHDEYESVSNGFSEIYDEYEELNKSNYVDQYMRNQVYRHVGKYISHSSGLLEINAGSGIDALYFASRGHTVLATDIAHKSGAYIMDKATRFKLPNLCFKRLSFGELHQLLPEQFEYIYSNFGGLNCTPNLPAVLGSIENLLVRDGYATLVVLNKNYIWDWLRILKFRRKKAFYRRSTRPIYANIKSQKIRVFYYSPREFVRLLPDSMKVVNIEPLSTFYPNVNHPWLTKYPRLIKSLLRVENLFLKLRTSPFFISDYFIITLQKR